MLLDLSDTNFRYFGVGGTLSRETTATQISFPSLQWLLLDRCPNLTKIICNTPVLKFLSATGCEALKTVEVSNVFCLVRWFVI